MDARDLAMQARVHLGLARVLIGLADEAAAEHLAQARIAAAVAGRLSREPEPPAFIALERGLLACWLRAHPIPTPGA